MNRVIALSCIVCLSQSPVSFSFQTKDFFDMSLDELLNVDVTVASLTETSKRFQPASVTVIEKSEIANSAARTINDLLMEYVPGYFRAEDKDDIIASFRGVAPDNNTKVMLLVDGVRVNANWFWGPADAILNGYDLSYVNKIEVIRGPGSVTLGQGAQLGVISIETVNASSRQENSQSVGLSIGNEELAQLSYFGGVQKDSHQVNWHISAHQMNGASMEDKGWGGEVIESDSSHPNPPSERGNRLNRTDSERFLLDYSFKKFSAQVQYHRQKRDLYNWTKDRDQLEQRLIVSQITFEEEIAEDVSYSINASWHIDDYALYDLTTGLVTGGAREERLMLKPQISVTSWDELKWVIGLDIERYSTGSPNWMGDNFIVNRTEFLDPNRNELNTWVFDDEFTTNALFSELSGNLTERWSYNVGLRYDEHPQWGGQQSTRLSGFYQFNGENTLRLTYQEGFRGAPGVHYSGGFLRDGLLAEENFDELATSEMTDRNGNELVSLSKVDPETIQVFEIGFNSLVTDSIYVDSVLYLQRIDDILFTESTRNGTPEAPVGSDLVGSWGGVFYYANAMEPLEMWGMESSISIQMSEVSHKLLLSHSAVLASDGFDFAGKSPVAGSEGDIHSNGIPEQMLKYHFTWHFDDAFTIRYSHQYFHNWWAPSTNKSIEGFSLGSARLTWAPSPGAEMALKVGNVWGADNLYPIRANNASNLNPGTPSIPSRYLSLGFSYQF